MTNPMRIRYSKVREIIRIKEIGVFIALLAICIILTMLEPKFLTISNLLIIGRQIAIIGIIAVGQTFLLIGNEFDLSVGAVFGLTACVIGLLMSTYGLNILLSVFIGLLLGAIIGAINGTLATVGKIPSFIVTLGMLSIARGSAFIVTGGGPVVISGGKITGKSAEILFFLGNGKLFGIIPMQFVFLILMIIAGYVLLSRSSFGFRVYALGGNIRTAILCGIGVTRIKIICFIITGVLCAIAGTLHLAFMGTVQGTVGTGYELDVIAAVIIGGTKLGGGEGTILGTLIGATIMGVLRNGMVLLGVSPFYQIVFIGIIIIVAVGADKWLPRRY